MSFEQTCDVSENHIVLVLHVFAHLFDIVIKKLYELKCHLVGSGIIDGIDEFVTKLGQGVIKESGVCALEISYHFGKIDLEIAEIISAKEIAHGEEGIRVNIVARANITDSAFAKAESNIEPANGHKQEIIVANQLPHRVMRLIKMYRAHNGSKVSNKPRPCQYSFLGIARAARIT